MIRTICLLLFASFFLSACGSHVYHQVRKGDTLYSISFRYHQDFREVAKWNDISSPYVIKEGQWLRITPQGKGLNHVSGPNAKPPKSPPPVVSSKTVAKTAGAVNAKQPAKVVSTPRTQPSSPAVTPLSSSKTTRAEFRSRDSVTWQWPINGVVISRYKAKTVGRQGVDIAGAEGLLVNAAASGRVVYSGNALRGYGNLIIIKHNDKYLSAYGNNKTILVKEGTEVKRGQAIARIGKVDAERVKLHFQIRVDGKPVNPMRYLPKRGS
ncbi:peptidoglycan DD-metalloendopeptidase family protein [Pseudomonadota bacterium]